MERARRVDVSGLLRAGGNGFELLSKPAREPGNPGSVRPDTHRSLSFWRRLQEAKQLSRPIANGPPPPRNPAPQSAAAERGSVEMPPWHLNDASIEQDRYLSRLRQSLRICWSGWASSPTLKPMRLYVMIHRSDGGQEFYFIANGETQPGRNVPFSRHRPAARVVGHSHRRTPRSARSSPKAPAGPRFPFTWSRSRAVLSSSASLRLGHLPGEAPIFQALKPRPSLPAPGKWLSIPAGVVPSESSFPNLKTGASDPSPESATTPARQPIRRPSTAVRLTRARRTLSAGDGCKHRFRQAQRPGSGSRLVRALAHCDSGRGVAPQRQQVGDCGGKPVGQPPHQG